MGTCFSSSYDQSKFEPYTFELTPEFSLKDQELVARVVDIYDGDTITVVLNIFNKFFKFTTRLSGIDTCEMKSKENANKELAYKARNRLVQLITSTIPGIEIPRSEIRRILNNKVYLIKIKCGQFDKYGRLLGEIYVKNESLSLNQILINEKLAYSYDGKTKYTEEVQVSMMRI